MAEYTGNEGYDVVYDMINDILKSATGSSELLGELSGAYKKPYTKEPNYDEEQYREAYLYLYSPMLSFATTKILNKFADNLKQQLADKEVLNVCCIGGGPATELLVLIEVLKRLGILPRSIRCTVLDKYQGWKETSEKLMESRQLGSIRYVRCDLTQKVSPKALSAIQNADLVTIIMTYSRLPSVPSILGNMKEDSTLLYMDTTSYDHPGKLTMKDRFLTELPKGFRKLSSVENEFCDSRKGPLFQQYPGMNYYYRQTIDYHQMAEMYVSALILTKQAATSDDQDPEPSTDEDDCSGHALVWH